MSFRRSMHGSTRWAATSSSKVKPLVATRSQRSPGLTIQLGSPGKPFSPRARAPPMVMAPANARRAWRMKSKALAAFRRRAECCHLISGFDLPRRLAAEALGTAILVATVVGSGIMAESLTRDVALALLGNTLPTGPILVVLITTLGPISGAHFNPAVSLAFALKRDLTPRDALSYMAVQVAGGVIGTMMAHAMFALPLLD